MQPAHTDAVLGPILIIARLAVFLSSPRKLRTLGRMALGFLGGALLVMIPTSIARRGDPQMWGEIAAYVAMVVAPGAGPLHVLALKRAAKQATKGPSAF